MSQIEQRQSLTPLAKDFKTHGVYGPHLSELTGFQPKNPNSNAPDVPRDPLALEAWFSMKPELYALSAILIEKCVDRALDNRQFRPPFGLIRTNENTYDLDEEPDAVKSPSEIGTGYELNTFMYATLAREVYSQLDDLKHADGEDEDTELLSVYNRYKTLIDFRQMYIHTEPERRKYETFILRGISTATEVMSQLVDVVPHLSKNNDVSEMVSVLTLSYPLISEMARNHLYMLGGILKNIKDPSATHFAFDPKHFRLIDTQVGQMIDLTEEARKVNEKEIAKIHTYEFSGADTLGCPARVNFNGSSALRSLWDWHIELSESFYQVKKQSNFVKAWDYS